MLRISHIFSLAIVLAFAFFFFNPTYLAYASGGANPCGDATTPATLDCLVPTFNNIVHAALIFIGTVVGTLIVISGYKFITSGGDSKQIEGAQKTLTYAIIGLVVVLFSFFIINIISYVTGVKCIQNFGLASCQ